MQLVQLTRQIKHVILAHNIN